MSKVWNGLRGDALVATREFGFDKWCEIADGRPRGIDTLIEHLRGMVFLLTEHECKEFFFQHCRPEGPLSRQNGEYETVCLATTMLLDTSGSDGSSYSSQWRTSIGHAIGFERLDT